PSQVYGDFRNPNEPGSGGAGAPSAGRIGGNGGGLVRIVAETMNLNGQVLANGGGFSTSCCEGGGSGGGIRIDVGTLSGAGLISAKGGNGSNSGGGGGGGRIAFYYRNLTGFNLSNVHSAEPAATRPIQMVEQGQFTCKVRVEKAEN